MTTLWAGALLLMTSLNVVAQGYISDEFNTPGSQAVAIYTCAVTGAEKGFEPEAFNILQSAFKQRGAHMKGRQAANLKADAYRWYESEQGRFDFDSYWHGQCAPVFARMERAINA
ncbi:hypothetical protein [Kushneria phyllosphaerae]|uniref:Valyl-tRNA synthetase n=1 Tax=Kushneria phyllosphaerae TaxID=2100822 RepID=A0A2R8CIR4_9GAMM|nr:hypothetical protein [Kushneria phyllosphaerae]SPJ32702.1 hypothetical protein KSP9073_00703 [Kushneria phyllosphaerae]